MGKKYTIEVPNLETLAYIGAVLNPNLDSYLGGDGDEIIHDVFTCFAGGEEGMRAVKLKIDTGLTTVWKLVEGELTEQNCNSDQDGAPWLKPQAPTEINGDPVTCKSDGVKVGCTFVPLKDLELIVKECKECEDT